MNEQAKQAVLVLYLRGAAPSTIVRSLRTQFGIMPRVTKAAILQAHELIMERITREQYDLALDK